jgi:pimeloyl-ACP methyl ester carboxylesterase
MSTLRSLVSVVVALGFTAFPAGFLFADEPTSQTFDAKGVKIHYLIVGKGEPVVLIHGLYSSAEINWSAVGIVKELAKDHQVIALDLPGHGKSDKPEKEDAYGMQMVEDVVLLMDHVKVKKAHVVGYSLGGIIAMKLIATHTDRVLSGTLGGMGWLRDGGALQKVWDKLPANEGGKTPPACLHSVGKLAVTEDELKKIDVPMKILVGSRDVIKPLYVEPLKKVRKDWPVVEIDGAGHIDCIVKKQFREELVGWVGKNTK